MIHPTFGPPQFRGPWCCGTFLPASSRSTTSVTCLARSDSSRCGSPYHPGPGWETHAAVAGVRRVALVARHDAFRVFAIDAADPERAARLGAQVLASRAERGLACALGSIPRRLVCATWRVGTGARAELGVRAAVFSLDAVSGSTLATLERCAPLPGRAHSRSASAPATRWRAKGSRLGSFWRSARSWSGSPTGCRRHAAEKTAMPSP